MADILPMRRGLLTRGGLPLVRGGVLAGIAEEMVGGKASGPWCRDPLVCLGSVGAHGVGTLWFPWAFVCLGCRDPLGSLGIFLPRVFVFFRTLFFFQKPFHPKEMPGQICWTSWSPNFADPELLFQQNLQSKHSLPRKSFGRPTPLIQNYSSNRTCKASILCSTRYF